MLELVLAIALAIVALGFAGLVFYARLVARRVERAVPPLGRFVEVDGAKLHYVDRGEGPPIVMIHGIGANLRHYTHTILDEIAQRRFDKPSKVALHIASSIRDNASATITAFEPISLHFAWILA